jgi:DNA-binding NarL/FixJ family response regulator
MSKSKILIVDDHQVVIEGIKGALQGHSEFEVVAEALDGLQAVELAKSLKIDIVIMDISMPNLNGIEATQQMKQINPEIRIVIYTMHSDKGFVVDLFKSGISAYVLKQDSISDLILALKAVKGGGTYFNNEAPNILARYLEKLEMSQIDKDDFEKLSFREREVFCLLADGKTVKEIGELLYISPKTVESHKYNIMEKLNVHTIADLTKIAIKKNLIKV